MWVHLVTIDVARVSLMSVVSPHRMSDTPLPCFGEAGMEEGGFSHPFLLSHDHDQTFPEKRCLASIWTGAHDDGS